MARTQSHQTRTDSVHEQLRSDILSGRHRPGSRLAFAPLQQRYAVSVGVLREALIRLAGEGLVRSEPNVGFTVVPLSRADLVELTDARVALECMVFARSIQHGDTAWEARAVASHHMLRTLPVHQAEDRSAVDPRWAAAHLEFHQALLAGCPNGRLRGLAESLRAAAELYRAWSQTLGSEPDRDVAAEHAALLDAAIRRDHAGAAELLAAHIERTAANLAGVATDPDASRPDA